MEKVSHQLFYQGGDSQDLSHDDDNNHYENDQIDISKVKQKFLRTFNSHSMSSKSS